MELGSPQFWDALKTNPEQLAVTVCSINAADLDRTLQEHPALVAWVVAAHESAKIVEARARWELTKAEAIVTLRAKAQDDPDTEKPKTIQVLRAEVDASPEVGEATDHLFTTQERTAALRAMVEALRDRRDMLVQLAAKQRDEQRQYQ